ncbi:MAG: flagellar hook-basal body protein [Clostridia bacterium]|jgi:flagellar basal-body rod protein FlgF
MLRSLYTSGTAMITLSRRMDTVANNLSNADTAGYKKDLLVSRSFRDMLVDRIYPSGSDERPQRVGPLNLGIHVDEVVTSFEQGALEETGNPLDLAIRGGGFLIVENPNGEIRYTRGGSFQINGDGCLVTATGESLLDIDGQPIPVGSSSFTLDGMGNLYLDDEYVTTLALVDFAEEAMEDLRKTGEGQYMYIGDPDQMMPFQGELVQGSLEDSNVNVIKEMMDMMEINRSYESNQRVVRMLDESLGKAVNEIALR